MLSHNALSSVTALIDALQRKNETLATAESCTGGLLGAALTHFPGISAIYLGGINAYSNNLKESLLNVNVGLMIEHGAVSEQVATVMARQVRLMCDSVWSVAITGVAGPSGGTPAKPVGLVCFAIEHRTGHVQSWQRHYKGTREAIRDQAVGEAASGLTAALLADEPYKV